MGGRTLGRALRSLTLLLHRDGWTHACERISFQLAVLAALLAPFTYLRARRPASLSMSRLPRPAASPFLSSSMCVAKRLHALRTRPRRDHVFVHVSCITDLAFSSEHHSQLSRHRPAEDCRGRGRLVPLFPLPRSPRRQSRENVIMVVRKDQICRQRPLVSQCDYRALHLKKTSALPSAA